MDKVCVNNGRSDVVFALHSPSLNLKKSSRHTTSFSSWMILDWSFYLLFIYFLSNCSAWDALFNRYRIRGEHYCDTMEICRFVEFELLPRAASDLCGGLKVNGIYTSTLRHCVGVYRKKHSERLPTGRPEECFKNLVRNFTWIFFLFFNYIWTTVTTSLIELAVNLWGD